MSTAKGKQSGGIRVNYNGELRKDCLARDKGAESCVARFLPTVALDQFREGTQSD